MTKHEPMGEECSVCDEEWPCDAYRRTKNYRIEVLENEVRQLKVQFYRRIEESPKAWLEYDNRLKAMETYNQRLYDQGRRITKLESSSEKTGCGVTAESKHRVWVGMVSPGYGEPDYPAGVFSTEAKAEAWAQAEPGRVYDEFEVDGEEDDDDL